MHPSLPAFLPPACASPTARIHPRRCIPLAVTHRPPPSTEPQPTPLSPTNLRQYLTHHKALIDQALSTAIQPSSPHSAPLVDAINYSLLAGGKRIRPILAIAAFQLFAPPHPSLAPVLPAALAVEMIHTMSLIHDDLPAMDNDDFRRGQPTCHNVYGEPIAILAGDALLSYAFEYVARNTRDVPPDRVVQVLALLTAAVGPDGLAGGQAMDLRAEGEPEISLETLNWIHTHKTAVLLRVSCASGAILAGATPEDVDRVSEFAVKIGLAFQIADDVLDLTQTTQVLGKTAGKDVATQKATYPRLLGLDASRERAKKLIAEAKNCLAPYGERSRTLCALADFIIHRSN